MIVVQLNGGLGNQLFQYALGRKLALCRNSDLRFDLRAFDHQGRQYKLGHYNVFGSPADPFELSNNLWWGKRSFFTRPLGLLDNLRPYYRRHKISEISNVYDENILKAPPDVYISGYWQSEKYFKDIRSTLQKEIVLKDPLPQESQQLRNTIMNCESVSLHVRRGDYVTNRKTNEIHGILPLEYYHEAVGLISNQIQSPEYFIFSDDISWAREKLRIHGKVNFVEDGGNERDHEDLILMSQCKHHIIANSSFSWWGAWLCQNSDKKVIAPRRWYKIDIDTRDLIPEDWTRL